MPVLGLLLLVLLCLFPVKGIAATADSLTLGWTNNDTQTPAPTFPIERGPDGITWTQIAETASGITTYTDTGLSPSTTYWYRVKARNSAGDSGYSNTDAGTTLAQVSYTATVAWTAGTAAGHTSWSIEKTTDGAAAVAVGTPPASTTQFVDTVLTAGHTYTYAVAACNSFGCAASTAPVSVSTNTPTGSASGVTVIVTPAP